MGEVAWSPCLQNASPADGGNYVVVARNAMGEKDCTLALNFGELASFCGCLRRSKTSWVVVSGGPLGDEENIPAKIYEQPELKQPDANTLILEAHIHANPKPKVTWLCNGDFIKESDTK